MHFQEVSQHWSWRCQRAQPALYYSSPISTRPSPRIALFSLQPLILPTGEDFSSDTLAAQRHPRNCPVLATSPVIKDSPGLCPRTNQSSWLIFGTLDYTYIVSFTTSLAKHKHQVRTAVHKDKPIIHHHHVQPAEGFHPLYDPTRADHGGAGWWRRGIAQHGGTLSLCLGHWS